MRTLVLTVSCAALAACASTPSGPPDVVANEIVDSLDEGRVRRAKDLFESSSGEAERIYPILYGEARERYDDGDAEGSARILRFMRASYPDALAVRQALVYALFLRRAERDEPEPSLVEELALALEDLRASSAQPPVWAHLVAAQVAIDRGRAGEASAELDAFLERWEGSPPELAIYVEDLDRWLRSH